MKDLNKANRKEMTDRAGDCTHEEKGRDTHGEEKKNRGATDKDRRDVRG
ncbi:MAG: hypothetical protein IJS44_01965 [Clostridia bacterium]|nr:hypothetical protein [Clostridia bacterium]